MLVASRMTKQALVMARTHHHSFSARRSLAGMSKGQAGRMVQAMDLVYDYSMSLPNTLLVHEFLSSDEAIKTLAQQVDFNRALETHKSDSLPRTLHEALDNPSDLRAIVVTSTRPPFKIVAVNDAWVGLCGYSKDESRHQTVARLLHGRRTDVSVLREAVAKLREGKGSSSAVVTNYTKSGRPFQNKLRMGPLYDNKGQIKYFVGVLEELEERAQGKLKMMD